MHSLWVCFSMFWDCKEERYSISAPLALSELGEAFHLEVMCESSGFPYSIYNYIVSV